MKKDFNINESLSFGWNIMKENLWFFVGILIVFWLLTGIPSIAANNLQEKAAGIALLLRIIQFVLQTILSIGLIHIQIKFLEGKKPEFGDLFNFQKHFWRVLGASILFGLMVGVGFIFLIVPGIYLALRFQYFAYCIVDRNAGVTDSFRQSTHITHSVKWKLLGFSILIGLINVLGFLCLFIGLFVTVPTTMMAIVFVYRRLLEQTPEESSMTAPAVATGTPAPGKIEKPEGQ
jgi:uncharacterized membrane protein